MSVDDAETDDESEPAPDEEEAATTEEPAEESTGAETDNGGDTEASGDPVPVGVKLGSTRTVIAMPGDGDDLETVRTLTCLATYEDAITGQEQVIFGEEAAEQYPDRVQFTLRSGLPEDEKGADLTRRFFQSVIEANDVPENSGVVYAIPTIENERGLANLQSVVEDSGIGEHFIQSYPESLCGAIPAFGDGLEAINEIFLAVNMGSTNLEASAYRRGEQLAPFTTGAVTGNEVDRRIANYVEAETQGRVNVDTQTAREYKEQHADFQNFEPFTDVIQQPGGGAHEFTIERSVMDAVDEYLDEVVEEFANTFLPELANDHMKVYQLALDQPIVLTGGMACIPGIVDEFAERASEALNRDVEAIAPDEPDLAATIGAQRIAARLTEN
ncbi:acetate and sugar kinases/Hsc70/actin family protein [Halorhabdus amylolytica]|uniref:cell division FtsA domain-containing protein n=1 Tax=Halorhabdus amylolytica TaxID=2559573 RepID=UPI0010A9C022|nr:cell division FtsA domain-containing protein [Halorhabdus amylolytica]